MLKGKVLFVLTERQMDRLFGRLCPVWYFSLTRYGGGVGGMGSETRTQLLQPSASFTLCKRQWLHERGLSGTGSIHCLLQSQKATVVWILQRRINKQWTTYSISPSYIDFSTCLYLQYIVLCMWYGCNAVVELTMLSSLSSVCLKGLNTTLMVMDQME